MFKKSLLAAVAVAGLAALPLIGSADPAYPPGSNQGTYQQGNGGWNQRNQVDQRDRRDQRNRDQRDQRARDQRDRDDRANNNAYNRGYNNGYNPVYNNGYNRGYNNGYGNNRNGTLSGRVTGFSPFNLDVAGAPHIRLHDGTVINPTGAPLNPGERVTVYGHPNGDGTFEADRIDVNGGSNFGGFRF